MTRLTNDHREKICDMIVCHKFDPIENEFDKEKRALGELVYHDRYAAGLQVAMKRAMDAAPKGAQAFSMWAAFQVNAGGWKIGLELTQKRPLLCSDASKARYSSDPIFELDKEHLLTPRLQDYATRRKEMNAERDHLTKQVMGQLNPHFTFEKAVAAWPEIAAFANAVERSLPAPNLSPALADHKALNEALDLPPTKA